MTNREKLRKAAHKARSLTDPADREMALAKVNKFAKEILTKEGQ